MAKTTEKSTRSKTNKWKNEKSKVRRSKRTLEIKSQSSSGFQSKLLLSKKRISPRHTKKPPVAAAAAATATAKVVAAGSKAPKKKTKEKKASPSKAKTPSPKTKKSTSDTSNNVTPDKNFSVDNKPVKKAYVVFVGNLPYSVTKEQLEEHFRKTGGVKKVRIPTERGTNKPRGFAYIEFKDRISHKIGLRLHHTHLNGRQINVEFTSIGGNNPRRREKLQQKNLKLSKMKKEFPKGESAWK
ncbi:uncharacterized protein LOC106879991 [Octopus bimaculoides]|uniref:RRM domain-containing protein n=1 Tax=Octopus bimaculoides TaxID=37653 RepID=A0A0L8G0C0_OCTBM|nr:uncharacterized protein LOC106879991 [Octopus bimaculoides]|eukprot:XP_014785255.1 PREDICTED: nuclear localization sequence-binding protein-like [Octopus bimaculoides]